MYHNLFSYHTSFKVCISLQINISIRCIKQSLYKFMRGVTINCYISMK